MSFNAIHENKMLAKISEFTVHKSLTKAWFPIFQDAVKWIADHYKTGTPITLLNRPIPKLVDAGSWQVWKDRLLHYYTPAALRDAAMYLHCISKFW